MLLVLPHARALWAQGRARARPVHPIHVVGLTVGSLTGLIVELDSLGQQGDSDPCPLTEVLRPFQRIGTSSGLTERPMSGTSAACQ